MEDIKDNTVTDPEIRYMHDEYLISKEKLIERKKKLIDKVTSNSNYAYRIEGVNYEYVLKSGVILTVKVVGSDDISHHLKAYRNITKEDRRDMLISSVLEDVDSFTDGLFEDFKEIEWMYNEYYMLRNNLYDKIIDELKDWTNNNFDVLYLLPMVISIGETKYIVTENEHSGDAYSSSNNRSKIDLRPYIEYLL